jgi:DNA-binding NarL/FixJ family response regulator
VDWLLEARRTGAETEASEALPRSDAGPAAARAPTAPIRVLVADDDATARRAVGERLAGDEIHVIGEAKGGEQAVAMAIELAPDIVVMNLVMPGCDGITATGRIALQAPQVKVVLLSLTADPEAVVLALRSGAVGFLDKGIELGALVRTVRGVYRGEAALDRIATRTLIREFQAISARADTRGTRPGQTAGLTLSQMRTWIYRILGGRRRRVTEPRP